MDVVDCETVKKVAVVLTGFLAYLNVTVPWPRRVTMAVKIMNSESR